MIRQFRCSLRVLEQSSFAALVEPQRFFRQPKSPDRTRNETIADRQHRFRYTDHHQVRPHQHYTLDPTSWNRELDQKAREKANGPQGLSITQRLANLDEQAESRKDNKKLLLHGVLPGQQTTAVPSRVQRKASRWYDDVVSARKQWSCPRAAAGRSTTVAEAAKVRYQTALLRVLSVLQKQRDPAQHQTLVLALWAELLQGAEPLLQALCAQEPQTPLADHIGALWQLCHAHILLPALERDPATDLEVESLIHRLVVLTHPFTVNGSKLMQASASPDAVVTSEALCRLGMDTLEEAVGALRDRQLSDQARGSSQPDPNAWESQLTAPHCYLLWQCIHRLPNVETVLEGLLPVLLHACRHEVHGLADCAASPFNAPSLKRQLQPVEKENVPQALAARPQRRHAAGKEMSVDFTGIKKPVLADPEDVLAAVRCVECCIRSLPGGSPSLELAASRTTGDLLTLLEHSPNYDLDSKAVSALVAVVVHSGLEVQSFPLLRNRLLLLLSRLNTSLMDDAVRTQCLASVLQLRRMYTEQEDEGNDRVLATTSLRLEGVVLHGLLSTISGEAIGNLLIEEAQSSTAEGDGTLESLVTYQVRMLVPLWRSVVGQLEQVLPTLCQRDEMPMEEAQRWMPRLAKSLLVLRTQCWPAQSQVKGAGKHTRPFAPLDEVDERLLCSLLAQWYCGTTEEHNNTASVSEELFSSRKQASDSTLWQTVSEMVISQPTPEGWEAPLGAAKKMLRDLLAAK